MADLFERLTERARGFVDRVRTVDTDAALVATMGAMCELSAVRHAVDPGHRWEPGQPLRLLFAGYSGTRNTGADVRVEEMIRQVRHLLGDELADLSILTIDPEGSRGYFRSVKQLHLPQIFPRFVHDVVRTQHGVIACEGSMFKSKFANALSTLMTGALGCAVAENKIAIGYGGEAGKMDAVLEALVKRSLKDALVICRNTESQDVLGRLGVPTRLGTDTAWTFEPASPEVGRQMLLDAGWDGVQPVVALAPINAFWWPVKPDLGRGIAHAMTGAYDKAHYDSVYFHHSGEEVDRRQQAYIDAIASGVQRYRRERDCFVVLVGMEQLDRSACVALNHALGGGCPLFVSDEWDHREMVALLRACDRLISSRYHALVCSMPGLVASAGITMDERIPNLMRDRGTPDLAMHCDDPKLAARVFQTLGWLDAHEASVREGIGRCVVANLERMGVMGQIFVDTLRARHPELPVDPSLGEHGDPWDHLPPMSAALQALVERHRRAA